MDQEDDPDALQCDDPSISNQESVTIDLQHASSYREGTDKQKENEKIETRHVFVTFDTKDDPKHHNGTEKHKETKESVIIDMEDVLKSHYHKVDKHKNTKKKQKDKLDKTKSSNVFARSYNVYMGIVSSEESDYDPETRNMFVAWVFFTVFVCILINAICVAIVRYAIPGLREYIQDYMFFFSMVACAFTVIVVCLNCGMVYFAFFRTPPCPWISLVIACICYCVVLSIVTLQYKPIIVIVALVTTAILCLICVGLALTSFDFTKYAIFVIVFFLISIVLGGGLLVLRYAFGIYFQPFHIMVLVFSVFIICFSLIIEIQMILGGRALEFEEDDIGYPAFLVYLSIIILFLQLLRLCGILDLFEDFDFD